jgi:hygromycin-B 4-O-kinase
MRSSAVSATGTTSRPDPPDSRQSVDAAWLRDLLREHVAGSVADLRHLAGGEVSQAFAFTVGDRAYVLRLSANEYAGEAFARDAHAGRHFASPDVPAPPVVALGRCAGGHFAVSERVPGRRLSALPPRARRRLLPAALDALEAAGRVDVGAWRGYGAWGADGHGEVGRWRDVLASVIENQPGGYYRDWHALFSSSFLERSVYETVYRRILELAAHCPEERHLVHRDLQFDNVLTDGQRITGVVDWGNAWYGDRLYDAAWLAEYFDQRRDAEAAALLRERVGTAPGVAERMTCYGCHVGLLHLRFYAKTGRRELYEWTRDRLLRLVAR